MITLVASCALTALTHGVLVDRYGEAPQIALMQQDGAIIEVWAAPDGATWTILKTTPDGLSCMLSSGAGAVWPVQPVKGDPA